MAAVDMVYVTKEFLDFLFQQASPEEIINFKISDAVQARADELTEKNKTGTLTPEEKDELEQLLQFDLQLTTLRLRAMNTLKQQA